MSAVRIVDGTGRGITVEVPDAETTTEAASRLATFMRPDVYFTGEHHPHNDAVRTLLADEKQAAARALEEAQERLLAFLMEAAGE